MLFYTFQTAGLLVLLDPETGELVTVKDARTGCPASLMYSKGAILAAVRDAELAHASTFECA